MKHVFVLHAIHIIHVKNGDLKCIFHVVRGFHMGFFCQEPYGGKLNKTEEPETN